MSVCDKAADASCKGQCLRQGALAFGVGGAVQERRTVLVTGGARRIGRAICETLAVKGWRVIVHSRRPGDPDAEALAARLHGLSLAADLSEPLAAARLFQQACELAAMKDDGIIDRKEEKQLKKIRKAVARFRKELEKI